MKNLEKWKKQILVVGFHKQMLQVYRKSQIQHSRSHREKRYGSQVEAEMVLMGRTGLSLSFLQLTRILGKIFKKAKLARMQGTRLESDNPKAGVYVGRV